jgi:hypothetical protein
MELDIPEPHQLLRGNGKKVAEFGKQGHSKKREGNLTFSLKILDKVNLLVNFMKRECIPFPVDELISDYAELRRNAIELYVDLKNAEAILQFLTIEKNRKKLRRILIEIF